MHLLRDSSERFELWWISTDQPFLALLKPDALENRLIPLRNSLGFDYWIRVEALGYSGGIWILWKDILNINIVHTHP